MPEHPKPVTFWGWYRRWFAWPAKRIRHHLGWEAAVTVGGAIAGAAYTLIDGGNVAEVVVAVLAGGMGAMACMYVVGLVLAAPRIHSEDVAILAHEVARLTPADDRFTRQLKRHLASINDMPSSHSKDDIIALKGHVRAEATKVLDTIRLAQAAGAEWADGLLAPHENSPHDSPVMRWGYLSTSLSIHHMERIGNWLEMFPQSVQTDTGEVQLGPRTYPQIRRQMIEVLELLIDLAEAAPPTPETSPAVQ